MSEQPLKTQFNSLLTQDKYKFLKEYFSKQPVDLTIINEYLASASLQPPIILQEEKKQQVANIIYKACKTSSGIQTSYQHYMQKLINNWNTALTEITTDPEKTIDQEVEMHAPETKPADDEDHDWLVVDENVTAITAEPAITATAAPTPDSSTWIMVNWATDKFMSLAIGEDLNKHFIQDKFPEIFKVLQFKDQDGSQQQLLEMKWIASNIFEHFTAFNQYDAERKQQIIQEFVAKLQTANITTAPNHIGTIIIELILKYNIALNSDVPQEKMFLDAINKFNQIIGVTNSSTLSASDEFKDMRCSCINQLLECNEDYVKATTLWSKLTNKLFGSQVVASLANLTGITAISTVEGATEDIKNKIYPKILEVFKNSEQVKNQYKELKKRFSVINVQSKELKEKLEQDLLEILALEAQQKEIPEHINNISNFQDNLDNLKKKFLLAIMLSNNIYAFKDLSLESQQDAIEILYNQLNKKADIKELAESIKVIAMSSKLTLAIEKEIELDTQEGWWDKCKSFFFGLIKNDRLQGAAEGFAAGLIISKLSNVKQPLVVIAAGAALGAANPTLMKRLTRVGNTIVTSLVSYVAKEIVDIYSNPLGRTIANRIIRGAVIAVTTGALITAAVYAAPYVAPAVGAGVALTMAVLGGMVLVSGALKLTNIIIGKIRPLARFNPSSLAKSELGPERANNIVTYLQTRLDVAKQILSNKKYSSDEEKSFLENLIVRIERAIASINKGPIKDFFDSWAGSDGNKKNNLQSELYKLANYERATNIFADQKLSGELQNFASTLLAQWDKKDVNVNDIINESNNNNLLQLTKSSVEIGDTLLQSFSEINATIMPRKEYAQEESSVNLPNNDPNAVSYVKKFFRKGLSFGSFGRHPVSNKKAEDPTITPQATATPKQETKK